MRLQNLGMFVRRNKNMMHHTYVWYKLGTAFGTPLSCMLCNRSIVFSC